MGQHIPFFTRYKLEGYILERINVDSNILEVFRRSFHEDQLMIVKAPLEFIEGRGAKVIHYYGKRIINRRWIYTVLGPRSYIPISQAIRLSHPFPFSRTYITGHGFIMLENEPSYIYYALNMDSIHLPIKLEIYYQEISSMKFKEIIMEATSTGILIESMPSIVQNLLTQVKEDYNANSIEKITYEVERLKDATYSLMLLNTSVFLKRIRRVLDDDIEILSGGGHQYKIRHKITRKIAPVPHHGELKPYFPKMICKELGIEEVYRITCDEFVKMLVRGERYIRR